MSRLRALALGLLLALSGRAAATTLTGIVLSPGGSPVTGTLYLQLSGNGTRTGGACGTGAAPALPPFIFNLTAGNITGPGVGPYQVPGADCLTPAGLTYHETVTGPSGGTILERDVLISGTFANLAGLPSATPPGPSAPPPLSPGSPVGAPFPVDDVMGTAATVLSGLILSPGGTPVTGTLYLQLSRDANLLVSCGGPAIVANIPPFIFNLVNGVIVGHHTVPGASCLDPPNLIYHMTVTGPSGAIVFERDIFISGANVDISTAPPITPGGPPVAGGQLAGDVTGPVISNRISKLQGFTLDLTTAPTDGQVLGWSGALSRWKALTVAGGGAGGPFVELQPGPTHTTQSGIADVQDIWFGGLHSLATFLPSAAFIAPPGGGGIGFRQLDTGDLLSGILGVARGGTGKGSWTTGSVVYASGPTTLAEDNANLFFDGSTKQLTIGGPLVSSNIPATVPATYVFAGPTSGPDAAPAFRALTPSDLGGGFVKLQGSYPGVQETGSFNVDGAVGFGAFTSTYPGQAGTGATYTVAELNNTGTAGNVFQILFGDATTASKRYALWTRPPSGGDDAMFGIQRSDGNYGRGFIYVKGGAGSTGTICVGTDAALYANNCDGVSNSGYVAGFGSSGTAGNAGLMIDGAGNLGRINDHPYPGWPAVVNGSCLRITSIGNMVWDTACGTGSTGGVTSVAMTVPSWLTVTGSPITSTGTLAVTATSGQTANRFLATPDGSTGTVGLRAIAAGDLGLTTKGDLLTFSTVLAKLGVGTDGFVLSADSAEATGLKWIAAGTGSVTSVGNGTIGPLFSTSWATATTTPALSLDFSSQSANCIVAGPATGSPAVPTCRSIVTDDLPASGVTASTYGDATHVAQVTVDATGRLTGVSNVSITGIGGGGTTAAKQDEFTGDGSTVGFTLSAAPATNGIVYVALNGLPQATSAWSLAASTVTMVTAPALGAMLTVGYFTSLPASVTHIQEDFTGAGSTDFTLAHTPAVDGVLVVSLRGLIQPQTTWTLIAGTTLRFTSAVPTGDAVSISYNF